MNGIWNRASFISGARSGLALFTVWTGALAILVLSSATDVRAQTPAVQVATGSYHTCAILISSRVKCWGYNAYGQLGLGDTNSRGDEPGEMGTALPEVPLHGIVKARQVSLGLYHTCVLDLLSHVYCWGANSQGELGYGHANNLGDHLGEVASGMLPVTIEVAKIGAGYYHSCALMNSGAVQCWGNNGYGQLGTGDTQNRRDGGNNTFAYPSLGTGRRAIDLAVAGYSTCVLLDNNQIKCWGYNGVGTLGLGDTANRGDNTGEMGDSLPAVNTGFSPVTVRNIVAGAFHVCAVRSNNNYPKCWGYNAFGQLGLGDTASRGDGPGEMGSALPYTLGSTWQLSAGMGHTCSVYKCVGDNMYGQLGQGHTSNQGDNPGEVAALPAIAFGIHPTRPGVYIALSIAAGGYHSCALLDDGAIKCWGYNGYGQLGQGDMENRGDAPGEMGDALLTIDL